MKRMTIMLLGLMLACALCFQARAAENLDPTREGTLDVHFSLSDGTDLSGMRFDLYRVADVSANGDTSLCEPFAQLGTTISLTPTDAWAAVTTAAANLVRRNGLPPEQSALLNQHGVAHFPQPGEKILPGIYLVFPRELEIGGKTIGGSPTLTALPLADGGWNYNVRVSPKGGVVNREDNLEVVILWDDKNYESQRPTSVLIDLYCDGVLVDTQVITAGEDRQWDYKWTKLPVWKSLGQTANGPGSDVTIEGEHSWYVVERGADGYEKKYTLGGARRFVVINSIRKEPPKGGKLPQTGALWWPVPVLLLAGLSLICLGAVADKKGREYE